MKKQPAVEVIEVTREELLARRAECERELACLRSHRSEDRILRELDNIRFLLGEKKT